MNVFTIHDKLEISGFRNYWKSTENSDVIPQDDHALFTSIPIKKKLWTLSYIKFILKMLWNQYVKNRFLRNYWLN